METCGIDGRYEIIREEQQLREMLRCGKPDLVYSANYYVENASFLKLDNLSLSYNVGKINKWASLTVSAMVQNVFTITGYSGTDPEVPNGMDNSFYPRPRTYSVSLGLQF